jgi:hypothetical protein
LCIFGIDGRKIENRNRVDSVDASLGYNSRLREDPIIKTINAFFCPYLLPLEQLETLQKTLRQKKGKEDEVSFTFTE